MIKNSTIKLLVSTLVMVGIAMTTAFARPKENLKASTGRKSFSLIGLSVGSAGSLSQLGGAKITDKYDLNAIGTSNIMVDTKDSAMTTEIVQQYLASNKVGWQILASMTGVDKGSINMKPLLTRASYGVTSQNYAIIAGLMGDPKSSLSDAGRFVYPLFNNVYVMVYLNSLNAFQVYKLNNDNNKLIETVKLAANNRSSWGSAPLQFDLVADSRSFKTNMIEDAVLTASGVFNEDIIMTFTKLEKKVTEFQVATKLYGDKVLYARIGKKENVYPTQRFFAFEQIGDTTFRRVGIIRAKKVADNKSDLVATGGKRADTTTFNVVYGKSVKPGKLGTVSIVSRPDLGIGIMLGYDFGATVGFAPRFSVNVATLAGALGQELPEIANFKIYGAYVPLDAAVGYDNNPSGQLSSYTATQGVLSYGLGKEYRLGKSGFIETFAGVHANSIVFSYSKGGTREYSDTGYEAGLILGKNIGPSVQIYGKAQIQAVENEFEGNESGATFGLGLKFDF
ncbi:MAG: hypothetical protein RL449_467 [Bacteroidota bacterium]|jgi:hypothetical protein